jgi:hypothetical protein
VLGLGVLAALGGPALGGTQQTPMSKAHSKGHASHHLAPFLAAARSRSASNFSMVAKLQPNTPLR